MRKHPARRTRTAIAVAAVLSTVGLTGAYALGSTVSASGSSTGNGGGTTASRSSSNTSTYSDDGGYGDESSGSMVVSPSQNVPDTSSRAS